MAVGDGLADVFGRRWGKKKWFFSATKSYVGSITFAISAFLSSAALLYYFVQSGMCFVEVSCSFRSNSNRVGCFSFDVTSNLVNLLVISILCAAVELVPLGDDNVTVPLAAAALSFFLLH